ncbi:MAG: restriction endonuclease subunit S [Oscillospiraceae bacterium]|nr:restriction endonuclease subunit S [Oscillospiraceae bacterium]
MREMKDSGVEWIGEIPREWEKAKLKHFVKINSGEMISKEEYVDNGAFPIIGSNGEIGRTNKYNNEEKVITTGRVGTIGTIHIVKKSWITDNALIVKSNNINQKYLSYIIVNFDFKHMLSGTAQPLITSTNLKNQYITLPPLDEQQKISTYLDTKCTKIDSIIEKQEKVIEKLKEYKLSVITEAVTKGLNPDVKMKDSGVEWIGEIPEHWSFQKLKYATQIMRGKFNHRPRNDPDYYDGEYPFVQTGDVARALKFIDSYSQTLNGLGYSVSKEFPKGSICMTIAANVGDVAVLNFNACFPDSVVGFVPTSKTYWNYLYYTLSAMKQQLTRNAIISTQLNLNIEIIKEEYIPIAPLQEQHQIADYLDKKCSAIDKSIEQKQAIIEKLKEYKKSLIYEVVTGKREV